MESKNIFSNLSPLDHRYYLANRSLFEDLEKYLSEEAVIKYSAVAEAALVKTHIYLSMEEPEKYYSIVDRIAEEMTPDEVYAEEIKTQHSIRALVNVMKRHMPEGLRSFVHLGATSTDILDTSASMRIRDCIRNVVLPLLIEVEGLLIKITCDESATPQVGRTHGQHAVPITLGFAFAEYVSRLGKSIEEIERRSRSLKGKLAGAVGAYNAASLIFKDPEEAEKKYLGFLKLEPSEYSTQMAEPEYLLRLILELNTAFGIAANLADDLRNLQRSEISEVREMFASSQVGSSTMPQKRNPWNSEHVKSLWKAFAPRIMTFFMDQISDHQRDLTNSASSRFIADYIAGFSSAFNRMKKILSSLNVDRERLMKNLSVTGDLILAEAAYILLSCGGEDDAHEIIRRITLESEKSGEPMREILKKDPKLWNVISRQLEKTAGISPEEFFSRPELYRGRAVFRAEQIAEKYRKIMKEVKDLVKES